MWSGDGAGGDQGRGSAAVAERVPRITREVRTAQLAERWTNHQPHYPGEGIIKLDEVQPSWTGERVGYYARL